MCPPQPARRDPRFWGRFPMHDRSMDAGQLGRQRKKPRVSLAPELSIPRSAIVFAILLTSLLLSSCSKKPEPGTLVMIIEASPANLDPRVGIDAYSERIDDLIFDNLLTRDEHLNVQPGLAERWEVKDALTYIFHLHRGVRFHDGRPLTARDVKWSYDSLLQGKVRSTKAAAYRFVDQIETPDDHTVIFRMKEPYSALAWNLSGGAMGIVPYGSTGEEISRHPIGSGPFRFVSAEMDKDMVLERSDGYWGTKPRLNRVRFIVVPDTTTRALELRKGSADIAINALTSDMVLALKRDPNLKVLQAPGTVLAYLAFNVRDPILKDARVRQALAYAIDRRPLIHYLWRDFARPASSILPPESWAYDANVPTYDYNPERARQLLDAAGYPPVNGVRFHLTMKTSTEESSRLMAAVFQQQLRDVEIALDIRTFEFATFFSDITRGQFEMYSLRWVGGNEDPDIFEYVFHSARVTPNGANRSFYFNPSVDKLIDAGRRELDPGARRKTYGELQRLLAADVPSINLWYFDNVLVHSRRVRYLSLNPSGNYDFLKTADLVEGR